MRRLLPVGLIVTALGACQSHDAPPITVTDSAGVRFTMSPDGETRFALVDSVPLLSIGGPQEHGPALFSRVSGVHLDRDGRLWVAEGQSNELRIFNPDGSHRENHGRSGDGPGEFRRIRLLGAFAGDSVAVSDDALGRLSIFSPDGELIRTDRTGVRDQPTPRVHTIYRTGELLAQIPGIFNASSLEPDQLIADTAHLVRLEPGADRLVTLARLPGPIWVWTGRNQIGMPFTSNPGLVLMEGALHVVAGVEFRVHVYRGGALAEVYGVAREPAHVGQRDLDGYRATMEAYLPEHLLAEYLSVLDHPALPTILPAYRSVVASADGRVWAQRFSPDDLWDVYDADRSWLGVVEVPTGFVPEIVTDSTLVGIWRDSLQVEHVRAYRYRRE